MPNTIATIYILIILVSRIKSSVSNPEPITRCNSETTTSCFITGGQKMNWSEGHSFCRSIGGFLPQKKELRNLHLADLKTISVTWSAMFHQSGAYQWFTHKPSVARDIEWEEGYIPKPWTTQCSLFNSVTRKFLTANCDQENDVLCVIVETDKQKDIITPDNLILQLRSNVEDQDGWIEVDTKDFQRLTLTCSASLINTGNDITSTVNIHWSKDGIWMTNYQATIHPATILDTFKSSFLPLEVSNEDREAVKQGTFCCEVWVPFTTINRRSNCFLITLKNRNTFLVTLKIKEDHTRPTSYEIDPAIDILQNYPDSLMTFYKEFQLMIKAPVSVSKVSSNSESKSTGNAIYEFKFHIYPKDIKEIETEGENKLRQYEEVAKTKLNSDIFSGDESSVKLTTYCQSFTKTYEYGNVVEYPFTKAAHRYNSPYKCEVEKNKLSFPVCHWNYTHGAEIIFPKMCLRFDMCPRGFTSIEGKVCLRVISNISWDIGFHTAYRFKTAFTLLPNIVVYLYQQNASIIHHVSKYLEKSKIENMWLPLKRRHDKTPLISPYPNQDYYFGDPSGMMKFNWEEGHPRAELKCAVVSIINKTLYSVDCEANSNFVILIDVNKSTGVDEKDFNEENFRDTEFNDAYFDEGNNYNDIKISQNCLFKWMELPSLDGTKICYKIFDHEPFTWEEAKEYCNIKNARLASPQLGFRNWFYAKLLSSKKSWINIKTKNNLKDLTFEYVNWVPRANFTKSYGVMSLDGWFLANQEELYNSTICEAKPRMTYRPKITISRSQNNKKGLCVNIKNIDSSNIVQCFENGVQVLKKFVSNLKDCFSSLPLKSQGYYECETWSNVNSKLIKSNTYLYTKYGSTTYVVIGYDTEQKYDPLVFDSTFFQHSPRSPFNLECINNIYRKIFAKGEKINLSRVYFFEKNQKFHYVFAVECIKGQTSFCTSETNVLNAMNEILRELGKEQCVVHEVRSTIGCLSETTKDIFRNNRILTWSKTSGTGNMVPEELCILKNGDMVYRTCKGDFLNGYYWNKAPNGCPGKPSDQTIGIWNISKDPSGYFRGDYKTLSELTQQSESLLPVDFYYVSSAFEKLSSHPLSPRHVQFEEVVTTMDNMLSVTNDTLGTIYRKFNSIAVLLDSFQELSFNSKSKNKPDGRKFALQEKIVAECVDVSKHLSIIGYQSTQLQGNLLDSKKMSMYETEVAIVLPSNLTESLIDHDRNDDSVSHMLQLLFVVYKTDALFIDPSSKSLGWIVNSHIISATYENKVVEELKEGVKLFFRPKIKGDEMKCVFWDTEKNEMKGGWSEDGCVLLKINEGIVTCECSHLTSFCILVRYDETFPQSEQHKKVLTLISIIGCGLSMFGLTLVLTTFLLFRKWRKSLSNQILANLSFAILSSLGIFLFGVQQTWNSIICRIVAVSLHYFILVSFGWMLVEGVHQYLKFVKVVGTYIPRFMWKALVCAWGIPLLPVIVALAIDIDLYNDGTQSDICWLSKSLFFVGFVPLISLILLVNVILYILIIDNAIIRRKSMSSTLHYRDVIFSQISMAICVFILLGFTWIFGLLAISSANLLFSYLFCVFNTLQGFFIFIFHLCRDQSARRLWRKFLNNGSNSGKTPMTSQFTNSTLQRRQDNKGGAKLKTTTT